MAATLEPSSSIAPGEPPVAKWNTYVWVEDADETAARARDAGGTVVAEPFEVPGAGRMAVIVDPEGAAFCIWQARGHKGAKVVNEHGSVNFNGLATRDPEGARAFYGAVFGWKTLELPSGITWTLPGYGDHLEEINPGVRAMMSQMGAPEGFIDVVANLQPIADDDSETQPGWSVTFAVDDVAATVAALASSAGRSSPSPSTHPGAGWRSSRIRKGRHSSPASSSSRTGIWSPSRVRVARRRSRSPRLRLDALESGTDAGHPIRSAMTGSWQIPSSR